MDRSAGRQASGLFEAFVWAVAVVCMVFFVGGVLYSGLPEVRRRVDYVPVRIHMWLLERQRQRHPPTIPPPEGGGEEEGGKGEKAQRGKGEGREGKEGVTAVGRVTGRPDKSRATAEVWVTTEVWATTEGRPDGGTQPASTASPIPFSTSTASVETPVLIPSPGRPPATPTSLPPLPHPHTPPSLPSPPSPPTPTPAPAAVHLDGVRHNWQDYNNCGPATLAMLLSYYGRSETQYDVRAAVRPNRWDMNVSPHELAAYVRSLGLEALVREGGQIDRVQRFLDQGIPVMLELWYYPDPHGGGHYRMIVGYDRRTEELIAYDVELGPDYRVSYAQQNPEWQVFNRLYMVVYRPEQEGLVHDIVGEEMDDATMYQRALAVALAERDADPGNPFAWFNVGTNHAALGEYEEAAAAYDRARTIGLPFRMLWYQFGPFEAYLALGRYADVIALAAANLDMVGNQEESHYYLGRARQALGDLEAARRCYQEALKYHPGFAPAVEALTSLE